MLRQRSVIIDAEINVGLDGKIHGEVDVENVSPIISMISPIPGGGVRIITLVLGEEYDEKQER